MSYEKFLSGNEFYSEERINDLLAIYRELFPEINDELREYWGLARERPWSRITTDFHAASYADFKLLHDKTREIYLAGMPPQATGEALAAASIHAKVGYSIGISPWTDYLLQATYAPGKKEAVIVVAHDWYPIHYEQKNRKVYETPLFAQGLKLKEIGSNKYENQCPESFFLPGGPVVLFTNLFPDFRPPGVAATGALPKGSYSYEDCLRGFDAILKAMRRYEKVSIISWGDPVWRQLAGRCGVTKPPGLKTWVKQHCGEILNYKSGEKSYDYLPIAHPCMPSNQSKPHLTAGYRELGLGRPVFAAKAANAQQKTPGRVPVN